MIVPLPRSAPLNHAGFRFVLLSTALLLLGPAAHAQKTLTGEIEAHGWNQVKIAIPDPESSGAGPEARETFEALGADTAGTVVGANPRRFIGL